MSRINLIIWQRNITSSYAVLWSGYVKGVISTVPGSVWFGSVRNRSDFDASGSVNRKRV